MTGRIFTNGDLNFCKICPHCCDSTEKTGYIRCGHSLPLVLNEETRKKNNLMILVNQNKVMGTKELEIFLLASFMYSSQSNSYSRRTSNTYHGYKRYHKGRK